MLHGFCNADAGVLANIKFVERVFFFLSSEEQGKENCGQESYRNGDDSGVPHIVKRFIQTENVRNAVFVLLVRGLGLGHVLLLFLSKGRATGLFLL